MKRALGLAFLIAAAPALAEDTVPVAAPQEPAKARAPLKLRLEDAAPGAPRVTFAPREHASEPTAMDALPALGGRPSSAYEPRVAPGTKSSPFPADTNPTR